MADEASTTSTGRSCRAVLRRTGGARSPLLLRHHGSGLTVGRRPRPDGRATSLRGLVVGMTLAVIAWIAAAVVLFAGTPMAHADASPCPVRKSLVASDGDSTLRIRPEASSGSPALVHLCVDESTEAVRRWSLTATDSAGTSVPVAVQPLGDRLAIALTGDATMLTVHTDLATGAATFQVPLGF
jgi:hypothetical protein